MNVYFPDTANIGKRNTRAILFLFLSCIISIFYIFAENIYAPKLTVYVYNPITLYVVTFMTSVVFFSCALAVISYKSKKLAAISVIAAIILVASVSLLLGASPEQLLLALAFIPSGTLLSMCISRGLEKAHTVVGNAVIIALVFAFASMIYIYSSLGEVSRATIAYIVNIFREAFVSFYTQYSAQTGITGIDVSATFDMFVAIFPAFFCVVASVISYITATLSRALILGQGAISDSLTRWPLKMSRLASLVFITALIFSMLSFSGTGKTLIITMYNLMLILSPGFFLIGIRTSLMHFRRPSLFTIIFGVIVLVSCLNNPILLVLLVASSGALDNLFPGVRAILYGEHPKKRDN